MRTGILLLLAMHSTISACTSAPALNTWVEQREYKFHKDYSTIDTLGWNLNEAGSLSPNGLVKVVDRERGEVPNFSSSQQKFFRLEGKAATDDFLRKVANLEVSAILDDIYFAEIELTKPFKYEAMAIAPRATCDNKVMEVVTRVLNTGDMRVKIYDSNRKNITSKVEIREGQANVKFLGTDNTAQLEVGRSLFVGYYPQRYRCRTIDSNEDLRIEKDRAIHFGGVDFRYVQYRTIRDQDTGVIIPTADVYIVPSGYFLSRHNTAQMFNSYVELASLLADAAIDNRLRPVEQQILSVESANKQMLLQTQVLEAKLREQEQKSYRSDLVLRNHKDSQDNEAQPWMNPNFKDDKDKKVMRWVNPASKGMLRDWDGLIAEEKRIQEQTPTNIDQLSQKLQEQSSIAERKAAIVAKVVTDGPQILTSAKLFPLAFGTHLSLPGEGSSSGVYLEVKDVGKDFVRVRVQHLTLGKAN